jgi:putative tryptophan/tyrosine transport system substrate-binding protein
VTTVQIDLTAKRMQLLKEILHSLAIVIFLSREGNPGNAQYVQEAENAARALGVGFQVVSARSSLEFEDAFRAARTFGAGALVPMDDAAFTSGRRLLVELAERYRLPGVYPIREFVVEGGLISLGPRYEEIYRRAATFVDKILKGAKPADIPVEQSSKFEFVINLKTAKQIGVTIPPNVLARADRVIR